MSKKFITGENSFYKNNTGYINTEYKSSGLKNSELINNELKT